MHKFYGADGIRGIACIIVLLLHNTSSYIVETGVYTRGVEKYGVWLFFTLSAFLLTFKFIQNGITLHSLFFYFLSRSLRIIPPFFICALFYFYNGVYDLANLRDILSLNGTYGHLWTVPVEFKFYFILPFFAFSIVTLSHKIGTINTLYVYLFFIIIHQYYYPYTETIENTINLIWYIPVFSIGVVTAIIYSNHTLNMDDKWRDFIGVMIILLLFSLAPGIIVKIYHLDSPINLMNKFIPLGVISSVFILLFCDGKGRVGSFVSFKIFKWFGKYSFSIYLYHFYFLFLGKTYAGTPYASMACSLFFGVGMGVIMYYLVEYPTNILRSKLENNIKKVIL